MHRRLPHQCRESGSKCRTGHRNFGTRGRSVLTTRDDVSAAWDRLTASTFTVVQEDGVMMTKAERLTQFKAQKPTPFEPRTRERVVRYGEAYVARYLSGGAWLLELWVREDGHWKAAAVQVTTAKQ